MKTTGCYLLGALVTAAVAAVGISVVPPALAECQGSGGVTACAEDSANGGVQPADLSNGPYYPYDCQDDWLCGDGAVSFVFAGTGGHSDGCLTPYGTYQNCNPQGAPKGSGGSS